MFKINKKIIIALLVICFFITVYCFSNKITTTNSPKPQYTVVIDAGHGGIDGGSVGYNGTIEAEINLEYANTLSDMMKNYGFNVVKTRNSSSGLYNPLASNKKKDDMKKRKEIIENSNADFVISIHMNSFSLSSRGAQVFYGKNDESSKKLANCIQSFFIKNLSYARKEIKIGDYYILNAIKVPSVLIECGFISNPKEEELLITEEYKKEVCYNILLGVLSYFD